MPADYAKVVAATRALGAAFARQANAGAVDRLVAACYADDALVLPPNLPLVRGRGQIRELFREMIETGWSDVARETVQVNVVGDLGDGVGAYACTVALPTPEGRPFRDRGKNLLVYRRQADGTWKVAVDVFSSDLPAR